MFGALVLHESWNSCVFGRCDRDAFINVGPKQYVTSKYALYSKVNTSCTNETSINYVLMA